MSAFPVEVVNTANTVLKTDGLKEGGSTVSTGFNTVLQKAPNHTFRSFNMYSSGSQVEVWDMTPYESAIIQIQRNSGHSYSLQGSHDKTIWFNIPIFNLLPGKYPIVPDTFTPENSSSPLLFGFNKTTKYARIVRITQGGQISPTTLFTFTLNAFKLDLQIGELDRYYNSVFNTNITTAVTSATPVQVAAIPGANSTIAATYKNGIKVINLSNSGSTGSMVQLLDGVAGTVKWTEYIPATSRISITLNKMIEFTLGNLIQLNVVTADASIYGTIQGTVING